MSQIRLTIPDAALDRVLAAIAGNFDYDPSGGETQTQFAKRMIVDWMKGQVVEFESTIESGDVRDRVRDEVDNLGIV